jgi:hypothetical protein
VSDPPYFPQHCSPHPDNREGNTMAIERAPSLAAGLAKGVSKPLSSEQIATPTAPLEAQLPPVGAGHDIRLGQQATEPLHSAEPLTGNTFRLIPGADPALLAGEAAASEPADAAAATHADCLSRVEAGLKQEVRAIIGSLPPGELDKLKGVDREALVTRLAACAMCDLEALSTDELSPLADDPASLRARAETLVSVELAPQVRAQTLDQLKSKAYTAIRAALEKPSGNWDVEQQFMPLPDDPQRRIKLDKLAGLLADSYIQKCAPLSNERLTALYNDPFRDTRTVLDARNQIERVAKSLHIRDPWALEA